MISIVHLNGFWRTQQFYFFLMGTFGRFCFWSNTSIRVAVPFFLYWYVNALLVRAGGVSTHGLHMVLDPHAKRCVLTVVCFWYCRIRVQFMDVWTSRDASR